jgi:hypothetical protein
VIKNPKRARELRYKEWENSLCRNTEKCCVGILGFGCESLFVSLLLFFLIMKDIDLSSSVDVGQVGGRTT